MKNRYRRGKQWVNKEYRKGKQRVQNKYRMGKEKALFLCFSFGRAERNQEIVSFLYSGINDFIAV